MNQRELVDEILTLMPKLTRSDLQAYVEAQCLTNPNLDADAVLCDADKKWKHFLDCTNQTCSLTDAKREETIEAWKTQKKKKELDVQLFVNIYEENEKFYVFISEENSSGYTKPIETIEDVCSSLKKYLQTQM